MKTWLSDLSETTAGRGDSPPRMTRNLGIGLLVVLLAGAGYLIAVRGEAIVVDLATLGSRIWCF
jgi:hypothetical protein